MQAFAIITGIVTLLAFFIQLRDLFPAHRETRKNLLIFMFGIFVGSIVSVAQGITVRLDVPNNPVLLMLYACIVILILLLVAAAMTWLMSADKSSKSDAGTFLMFGAGALMLMFAGAGAGSVAPSNEKKVGLEEYLTLGNNYEKNQKYEKSLYFLGKARSLLGMEDSRRKIVEEKIETIKLKQIEATFK